MSYIICIAEFKVLTDKIKDRIAKRESVISQAVMERMNKEIGDKLEKL